MKFKIVTKEALPPIEEEIELAKINKIKATKSYRERTGFGLKTSKFAIDHSVGDMTDEEFDAYVAELGSPENQMRTEIERLERDIEEHYKTLAYYQNRDSSSCNEQHLKDLKESERQLRWAREDLDDARKTIEELKGLCANLIAAFAEVRRLGV